MAKHGVGRARERCFSSKGREGLLTMLSSGEGEMRQKKKEGFLRTRDYLEIWH